VHGTSPRFLAFDGVQIPTDWKVDQEALVVAVQSSSFLFSLDVFDQFHGCTSGSELVRILTVAFEDCSHYSDRQWEFMAVFVLELAFKCVVDDAQTIEKLYDESARLKSLRARLIRRCRTVKDGHHTEITTLHAQLRRLRCQVEQVEEQLLMRECETNRIESTKSDICTEVVREIIELW
jgi:hypothetical protein